jgi:MoaA/NifB/PqqE/SkfB family radical SAM enzyme
MPPRRKATSRAGGRLDWIELVTGFACNCRCWLCSSGLQGSASSLSDADIRSWLARGRDQGATGVWFGGGEPTLHPGLLAALEHALGLGYTRLRLQTNGMRLSYPAYVARLARAGLTEAACSIKGWDARSHDAMTRRPGSWALLCRALENLQAARLRSEADVLLTSALLPHLPELVSLLAERGVRAVTFWLASLHGLQPDQQRLELVPALGELRASLRQAFSRADALGLAVTSLHTPPCSLAPGDHGRYLHAGRYRLLVVVPGAGEFMAEDSPMEGGSFPEELCDTCRVRPGCLGLRAEQLRLFGTRGLEPVG